jgi:hypothetical protein
LFFEFAINDLVKPKPDKPNKIVEATNPKTLNADKQV